MSTRPASLGRHVGQQGLVQDHLADLGGRHAVEAEDAVLGAPHVDAVQRHGGPAGRRAADLDVALLALVALHADARQAGQRPGGGGVGETADGVGGDHVDDIVGDLLDLQGLGHAFADRLGGDNDLGDRRGIVVQGVGLGHLGEGGRRQRQRDGACGHQARPAGGPLLRNDRHQPSPSWLLVQRTGGGSIDRPCQSGSGLVTGRFCNGNLSVARTATRPGSQAKRAFGSPLQRRATMRRGANHGGILFPRRGPTGPAPGAR